MFSLLTRRPRFRRLWLGEVVSMFGDWFTYVAIAQLALSQREGVLAVALVLVAHTLPRALLAPLAGWSADRYDRRSLMVLASLARGALVAAMVVAAARGAPWTVQLLHIARMGLGAFSDAASRAAVPRVVARGELAAANALVGASWSVVFALGVALGGVLVAASGPATALALDAATFVVAAGILAGVGAIQPERASHSVARPADTSVHAAWRHPMSDGELLRAVLGKVPVAVATGGGWILLTAVAARSSRPATTALALGGLHLARAVGTGIGPLAWAASGTLRATPSGLHLATATSVVGVAVFAVVAAPAAQLVATVVWGVGVGANWVWTTTRLQVLAPDATLGRLAAVDLAAHTIAQCVGGVGGALVAAHVGDARAAAWYALGVGAAAWFAIEAWARRTGAVSHSGVVR